MSNLAYLSPMVGREPPACRRAGTPGRHVVATSAALLLVAVIATAQGAPPRQVATAPAPLGKIVFVRSTYDSDGVLRATALYRMPAIGGEVRRLTPVEGAMSDDMPAWSPDGGRIAFSRRQVLGRHIHVMDSRGTLSRQVTFGDAEYLAPTWGPRGSIAFVARSDFFTGGTVHCLGIVRPDGRDQRILFCPDAWSSRGNRMEPPVWSADGRHLYVEAGYTGLTSGVEYSYTYRVDVASGVASLVVGPWGSDGSGPPGWSVSPDERTAVYGDRQWGVFQIDLADGAYTSLTDDGVAPLHSRDGRRIAFTRVLYSGDRRQEQLFVMEADGTGVRQLTNAPVDRISYRAVAWSSNNRFVLVNRTIVAEDAGGRPLPPRRALRLVDVETGRVRALSGGHAYRGGWWQPLSVRRLHMPR